jgi:hypothetical protein
MALFLLTVLSFSDAAVAKGRRRYPPAEQQYQQALKLVREAGLKYDPPVKEPS